MKRILSLLLIAITMLISVPTTAQTMRNDKGTQIGKVESDGTIRNANNSRVGKVESDGTVRNANNSRIGKVESDGTIRDDMNRAIGKASGIDKRYAAAIFFMNLL